MADRLAKTSLIPIPGRRSFAQPYSFTRSYKSRDLAIQIAPGVVIADEGLQVLVSGGPSNRLDVASGQVKRLGDGLMASAMGPDRLRQPRLCSQVPRDGGIISPESRADRGRLCDCATPLPVG